MIYKLVYTMVGMQNLHSMFNSIVLIKLIAAVIKIEENPNHCVFSFVRQNMKEQLHRPS